MPKWIQLSLFTGEAVETVPEQQQKQEGIAKTTRLALDIQLSIARLGRFTTTMKLVSELCERITGIAYPFNIDERRLSKQKQRQQQTERNVAAEIQKTKRKRGRPKDSRNPKPIDHTLRKQIDASFRPREAT